jgi:thioredoxin-like negative regulator of GroEL
LAGGHPRAAGWERANCSFDFESLKWDYVEAHSSKGGEVAMALIKEVLENILLVIQEKENPEERDNLLEGIIEELAELGFYDEARKIVPKVADKPGLAFLLRNIAPYPIDDETRLQSEKILQLALDVALKIQSDGEAEVALEKIGEIALENEQFSIALAVANMVPSGDFMEERIEDLLYAGYLEEVLRLIENNSDFSFFRLLNHLLHFAGEVWKTRFTGERDPRADELLTGFKRRAMDIWHLSVVFLTIENLLREGRFDDALVAAEGLKEAKERAIKLIAEEMIERGNPKGAKAIMDMLQNEIDRSRLARLLALALAEAGEFDEALEVTEKISYLREYLLTRVQIAWKMTEQGQTARAKALLNDMLNIAYELEDLERRSEVLEIIAVGLAKSGAFSKAMGLVSEIKDENAQLWVLKGVAAGLAKGGQLDGALNIVNYFRMPDSVDFVIYNEEGKAEVYRYPKIKEHGASEYCDFLSNIIESVSDANHFKKLIDVIEGIEDPKKRWELLQKVIVETYKRKIAIDYRRLYPKLIEHVNLIKPSDHMLSELGEAMFNTLNAHEVKSLVMQIKEPMRTPVVRKIVEMLAKSKRWEEAVEWAKTIESEFECVEALAVIAEQMVQAGEHKMAEPLLTEALGVASRISEPLPRAASLGKIATILALAGFANTSRKLFLEAKALAETGKESAWKIQETLEALAHNAAKANLYDLALDLSSESIWTVLEKALSAKDFQTAVKYAEEKLVAESLAKALSDISIHMAADGKEEEAEEFVKKAFSIMEELAVDYGRLRALEVLCQKGEFELARKTAEAIGDKWKRERAFSIIGWYLPRAGKIEEARELVQKCDYSWSKAAILRAMIKPLAEQGRFEEALRVAEEAEELGNSDERVRAFGVLCFVLATLGSFDKAIEVAKRVGREYEYERLLAIVGTQMARQGAKEALKSLVFQHPWKSAWQLSEIMRTLVKQKDRETFLELLPLCVQDLDLALKACLWLALLYEEPAPS